jgi:hypothetical protein
MLLVARRRRRRRRRRMIMVTVMTLLLHPNLVVTAVTVSLVPANEVCVDRDAHVCCPSIPRARK